MIQFETTADTAFSPITEREVLSSDQINSVLSQLTSTIELSTLGSLYFTQLATFLPVESLDQEWDDRQVLKQQDTNSQLRSDIIQNAHLGNLFNYNGR